MPPAADGHTNNNTAIVPNVFPWETMPYEIRDMIFAGIEDDPKDDRNPSTSYFYWKGTMPALVVALRSSDLSYGHVLEWLARFSGELIMEP